MTALMTDNGQLMDNWKNQLSTYNPLESWAKDNWDNWDNCFPVWLYSRAHDQVYMESDVLVVHRCPLAESDYGQTRI
jgi:hypothetical protein